MPRRLPARVRRDLRVSAEIVQGGMWTDNFDTLDDRHDRAPLALPAVSQRLRVVLVRMKRRLHIIIEIE